jgi:hypothetical protein
VNKILREKCRDAPLRRVKCRENFKNKKRTLDDPRLKINERFKFDSQDLAEDYIFYQFFFSKEGWYNNTNFLFW